MSEILKFWAILGTDGKYNGVFSEDHKKEGEHAIGWLNKLGKDRKELVPVWISMDPFGGAVEMLSDRGILRDICAIFHNDQLKGLCFVVDRLRKDEKLKDLEVTNIYVSREEPK
jgi:hypothetical protein